MRSVTITLNLEDDKFESMEKILLKHGDYDKDDVTEEMWVRYVIETYEKVKPYLDLSCNHGNLEEAYLDMSSDY